MPPRATPCLRHRPQRLPTCRRARALVVALQSRPSSTAPTATQTSISSCADAPTQNSQPPGAVFKPDNVSAPARILLGKPAAFSVRIHLHLRGDGARWIWASLPFDAETATLSSSAPSDLRGRAWTAEPVRDDRGVRTDFRRTSRAIGSPRQTPARLAGSIFIACVREGFAQNLVLMVFAAATAHFSVGSGTKLALESAIARRVCPQRADARFGLDRTNSTQTEVYLSGCKARRATRRWSNSRAYVIWIRAVQLSC